MQPKNIQTEEQLFALAEKIHAFLTLEVHTDDIEVAVERGHELAAYMANTGKCLADAKYLKDKATSNSIIYKMKDSKAMNLPASVMNELIKSETKDANYLVNWFDRLDREVTHQLDWLRTCISKEKAQLQYSSFQQ